MIQLKLLGDLDVYDMTLWPYNYLYQELLLDVGDEITILGGKIKHASVEATEYIGATVVIIAQASVPMAPMVISF